MSETNKSLTDQVGEVKNQNDIAPVLDCIKKVAGHVERSEKRIDERTEAIEKQQQRDREDLDAKMEKGFTDVLDRIDKVAERSSVLPHLKLEDVTEPLKAVMDKETKALIPQLRHWCGENFEDRSPMASPEVAASFEKWWRLATLVQHRKHSANHQRYRERLDKLESAFRDMLPRQQKAALQEDVTTEGGHMVPTIVEPEVLKLIRDASDIYPRTRQIPMTVKTHDIPDETTAVTVNWVSEEGTLTGGEPVFGKKTLTANKLAGRATLSIELFEDSSVAVLPLLISMFTEKMGGELDFQTMEGTTPFTGVNTAASVNALATTTGTAGADVTYADLTAVFTQAGEANTRANGIWVMSPAVWGKVLGLVDSNGQPIVKLGTVETAPNGTILGRPVVVSNRLGSFTVGSDATGNLYFGPPMALVFGTRSGMSWDVTDQVNWATYQMDARLVGRFAYVVGVPAAWTRLTKIHND